MILKTSAPAAGKQTGATATSHEDELRDYYTSHTKDTKIIQDQDIVAGFPTVGTTTDVAEFLQIREATVRELCRAEKLRSIKVGQHWRIPKYWLAEFIVSGGGCQQ